jgi:hypothetical protein
MQTDYGHDRDQLPQEAQVMGGFDFAVLMDAAKGIYQDAPSLAEARAGVTRAVEIMDPLTPEELQSAKEAIESARQEP